MSCPRSIRYATADRLFAPSRKDGTPFINLIMCVPLRDQTGKVRYYLGAQVDVTDLVYDCTGLHSLKRLMQRHDNHHHLIKKSDDPVETIQRDEFEQLSETFNPEELEKLIKLRERQKIDFEEKAVNQNSGEQREENATTKIFVPSLDNTFDLNGEGAAPSFGYYKTVTSFFPLMIVVRLTSAVPSCSTCSLTSHSLCVP